MQVAITYNIDILALYLPLRVFLRQATINRWVVLKDLMISSFIVLMYLICVGIGLQILLRFDKCGIVFEAGEFLFMLLELKYSLKEPIKSLFMIVSRV